MLSGAFYVGVLRLELGAVPVIVRLDEVEPDHPAFTLGPCDLFGTGECVRLAVVLAE
jgi:hypothetical protein